MINYKKRIILHYSITTAYWNFIAVYITGQFMVTVHQHHTVDSLLMDAIKSASNFLFLADSTYNITQHYAATDYTLWFIFENKFVMLISPLLYYYNPLQLAVFMSLML